MNDRGWLQLLEVIIREDAVEDAFVQVGGEELKDPHMLSVPLSGTRRLVAVLREVPEETDSLRERLLALCDAFHTEQESGSVAPPSPNASRSELDHALADVASRSRAEVALVFDVDSPVVWGCSAVDGRALDLVQLRESADIDEAVAEAGLRWDVLLDRDEDATLELLRESLGEGQSAVIERVVERLHSLWVEHGRHAVHRRLRMARAVRELRHRKRRSADPPGEVMLREPDLNCVCRDFATIYRLLLVYAQPYSPLHAEATLQKHIDHIERLVLALPPVDPGGGSKSKAARVLRLV